MFSGASVTDAPPVRILIADAQPVIRYGVQAMLDGGDGGTVFLGADDGADAVRQLVANEPDIAIIDVDLPPLGGIHVHRTSRMVAGRTRTILLTREAEPRLISEAVAEGITGVIAKAVSQRELAAAISVVMSGQRYLCSESLNAYLRFRNSRDICEDLSRRERQIFDLIALGQGNDAIGRALNIALPTVKFHVTNLYTKLGVRGRTKVALLATQRR